MALKFVTSTEFQNSAGRYFDEARKAPIGIKKHGQESHVLMDIEEYERLSAVAKIAERRQKFEWAINDGHERYSAVFEHLAK